MRGPQGGAVSHLWVRPTGQGVRVGDHLSSAVPENQALAREIIPESSEALPWPGSAILWGGGCREGAPLSLSCSQAVAVPHTAQMPGGP